MEMECPFRLEPDLASLLHSLQDEDLRDFAGGQEDLANQALIKLCVINFNPSESLQDSPNFQEAPKSDADSELYIYICFLIFIRSDSMGYFNKANQQADMWLSLTPTAHPDRERRARILDRITKHMRERKELFKKLDQHWNRRMYYLLDEALMLAKNYKSSGARKDIDEALRLIVQGMDEAQPEHPGLPVFLSNLVAALQNHYQGVKDMRYLGKYLTRAIHYAKQIHESWSRKARFLADSLASLADLLDKRFEHTDTAEAQDQVIEVRRMSIDATPTDDPEYVGRSYSLAVALTARFERTGKEEDVNRAIELGDKVVKETPVDSPGRPMCLNQLAMTLALRNRRTGRLEDLDGAIEYATIAAEAVTPNDVCFTSCQITLANALGERYQRKGEKEDIFGAVKAAKRAKDNILPGNSAWPVVLQVLGIWEALQVVETKRMEDFRQAIETTRSAIKESRGDNQNHAMALNTLANHLTFFMKVDPTKAAESLNEAISAARTAVGCTPVDHPNRAFWYNVWGESLMRRYRSNNEYKDLVIAAGAFMEGWNCVNAPPSIRIEMATKAAGILGVLDEPKESYDLVQQALKILPQLSPRHLNNMDKQYMLSKVKNLAATAAAAALKYNKEHSHALQLLEQGRGVIAGLLMEMREDLTDLKKKHKKLAEKFEFLRDKLDSPDNLPEGGSHSWEDNAKLRAQTDRDFNQLLNLIRSKDDFRNFLLSPTPEEMMATADQSPIIVIYLSTPRSGAFLIEHNNIRAIELPLLEITKVRQYVRELKLMRVTSSFYVTPMLVWLWDAICRPCLNELGFEKAVTNDDWKHVWWVPTGMLSQLPLHAAGRIDQGPGNTVLDRVISSYASSVKALLSSRRQHAREPTQGPSDKAILVSMTYTKGLPGLPKDGYLEYAAKEVEMVKSMCPSLRLQHIPTKPCKSDVLEKLRTCRIFHFSGHGESDPTEPSQSRILLEDWQTDPLTVTNLREQKLQDNPPFLGYLSACATGIHEADILEDEAIHLVSAFQLAGFRHIIGTLWEVSDSHCMDVAKIVYNTLQKEGMENKAVSRALHFAIRAVRDGRVNEELAGTMRDGKLVTLGLETRKVMNSYWVPYIHYGV